MSEIDPEARPALAPQVRLQTDPVSGRPVLLFAEGLLELDDAAEAILRRCDGRTTVAEMLARFVHEYPDDAEEVRADVLALLADWRHQRLLVL